MNSIIKALGIVLLVAYGCRSAPAPSPSLEIPMPPPTPVTPPPEEPKAVQLEKSLSSQGADKAAAELQNSTDDAKLSDAIREVNRAIEEGEATFQELKSRGQVLTFTEREKYNELAIKLAEARKLREHQIDTSYTTYRIEYKDLNRTWMQPESRRFLLKHLGELKAACAGSRRIVLLGFGCSIGSEEATESVSVGRASDVYRFLDIRAGCVEGDVHSKGLGVETPVEDLEGIDTVEVESILQKSRFVRLLIPKKIE